MAEPADAPLVVMSFNIHHGGGLPVEATAAVIRAVGADIVGVQETRDENLDDTAAAPSNAAALAEALGWYVHEQWPPDNVPWEQSGLWSNAIVSRWPIGPATSHDLGVTITTPRGPVAVFNLHLDDTPYQPYQLVGLEYGGAPRLRSGGAAVRGAKATRGAAVARFLSDLSEVGDDVPAVVFGDFNEPSHHDWTRAAAKAGLHSHVVAFPTALTIEREGFVDAFRAVHPDPVAKPGFTWTPDRGIDDPSEVHDRIDYVLVRGLPVISAGIVGPDVGASDVVLPDWPSDHRAVVATVGR